METQNRRILIADDDPIIADTLVQVLKFKGYEAIGVRSGEEAVAVASTFRPNMAVMDLTQSAVECAHLIVKQVPSCRIVLLSGRSEAADLAEIADSEGHQFEVLPKPVSSHALLESLAIGFQRIA